MEFEVIQININNLKTKTMKNIDNNSAVVNNSVIESTNPVNRWRKENGVIYFSVTSNGKTGKEWIEHLKDERYHIDGDAKDLLLSKAFNPTSGVTTEIAILTRTSLLRPKYLMGFTTSDIINEAAILKFVKPNAEVACLIREMISDKEMGAMGFRYITVMHEAYELHNSKNATYAPGHHYFMYLGLTSESGGHELTASDIHPESHTFAMHDGFAFVVR